MHACENLCMHVCVCTRARHLCLSAWEIQKTVLASLDLELQEVGGLFTEVLGTEL